MGTRSPAKLLQGASLDRGPSADPSLAGGGRAPVGTGRRTGRAGWLAGGRAGPGRPPPLHPLALAE